MLLDGMLPELDADRIVRIVTGVPEGERDEWRLRMAEAFSAYRAAVAFWERLLKSATEQPVWSEELARLSWSPMFHSGIELQGYLEKERAEFISVLGELGLFKAS